jgi:hypothetical protein
MSSPIRFIRKNEFSPVEIEALTIAFENACAAAGGAHAPEELRERLARRIMAEALAGERDPTALYLKCIKEAGLV